MPITYCMERSVRPPKWNRNVLYARGATNAMTEQTWSKELSYFMFLRPFPLASRSVLATMALTRPRNVSNFLKHPLSAPLANRVHGLPESC